jgi:hypothetical protein
VTDCPAVLDLGFTDDDGRPNVLHCEEPDGHPGGHYAEAWDPDGILW